MLEDLADSVRLSEANIERRCVQVASAADEYDFPGRSRTCEQYEALIRLFSRLDFECDNDLLAGSLAVYGWMPTMMDDLASRDALKALIAELKQVSSDSVPSILEKYRATGVLRAINNSIVGTSKLLHFFLPENIPIWDSVLGRSFGMIHRHQFHREDRFLIYVQAVHSAVRSAAISWKELDIVASQSSGPVSKVRKVEFALYAFARRRMALEGVPS